MALDNTKPPLGSTKTDKTDVHSSEIGAQGAAPIARTFPTGAGQHHTHAKTFRDGRNNFALHAGTPYAPITGSEIAALVENPPPSVPKTQARWFIPSTYREFDARSHDAQRAHGQFFWLTLDVDTGNLPLSDVTDPLASVLGPCRLLVYSTSSATAENRKWRALVPLKSPLAGADFADTQHAFFQLLAELSQGALIADAALERPAQLVYLPNPQTDFYEHLVSRNAPLLNLTQEHSVIQRREAIRAKREAAARAKPEARSECSDDSPDSAEVREILSYIPPDCEYNDWLTVLMGLHHKFGGSEEGLAIADEWSAQGDKYVTGEVASKWAGFKPGGKTSFSSVAELARQNGANLSKISRTHRGPSAEDFSPADPNDCSPQVPTEPAHEVTAGAAAKADVEATAREAAVAVAWPEPFDIFGDARPAQLSSPPPGSLPDVLERWSRSEARRKGVSEAFTAAAALAVVAGAIGNGLTIRPRRQDTDWKVPSALWIALVDQPGSGKSPVIAAALKPLNDLDAERRRAAADQAKLEQAARAADPKARKGQLPAKPAPRSLVDNVTMEKLVSLLAENPRGLLQKPDELAALFGALGAYKKSGEGDRGQLLRLYDGGSITVDRQGSGTTHAEKALLSILSGTQPDRIGKVARELGSDGMLQRFLFVLGDEVERGGGVDEAPDEAAARDYLELVRYLATAEMPGRAPVVLAEEAHAVLLEAEGRIRALKHCPGVPGAWAEHVAKWNGTLYRITLAFHAVECWRAWNMIDGVFPEFYPQPVSGETARRAALFSGFMLRHALAFYQRFFEHGESGKDARRFAGFILTAPERTAYSRRDVGQAVRELRDRRQLYQVTRELEDIGWLRAAARDAEGVSKWEVNPAVHVRFAERAKWETEERKAKRESIALATETRRNWLGADGEA